MNSGEIAKSYLSSPQSLISFMEKSKDPWWVKDIESRYIYANDATLRDANIPKNFNIEGRLDKEIPAPCEELCEEFVAHDKRVSDENKTISTIAIHHYGKGNVDNLVPLLSDTMPLYADKNKIIGTVGHGRIIDSSALLFYMQRFNRKIVQFDAPNDLFTPGELEIIFWAQQRLSAKEIAKRLNLAPRTIENRLSMIYEKAGVHSIIQLVEYCKQTGLDSYIPSDFIRKGFQLIE